MSDINKGDIKNQLDRVRAEHERLFGEELTRGELAMFFSQLLEYKRRKFIEGALADQGPEALRACLEILDEEVEAQPSVEEALAEAKSKGLA